MTSTSCRCFQYVRDLADPTRVRIFRPLIVGSVATALVLGGLPATEAPVARAQLTTADVIWGSVGGGFESQVIDQDLSMVGLTWDGDSPLSAWYRRKLEGRWGPWLPLPVEDEHGPDPGTDEAIRSQPGSDPVWVGQSDAIQFRMTGSNPRRTSAVLIDTSNPRRPVLNEITNFLTPRVFPASGAPGQPLIRPRSQWDPNNECQPRDEPGEVQVTHFFVHHTAGSNSYSEADVPGNVLGVCKFHVISRGWDDIAYNFLIDKYGNIWEGRAGGIDKGIQGGHTKGFSTYSVGVAFIGTYSTIAPSPAAETALQSLIAWKANIHNVNTKSINTVVSKGSGKYDEGVPVALYPISGHLDAQVTSCPGAACYNRLPTYRSRVAQMWSQVPISTYKSPLVGDFDGDGADEASVFRTTDGRWLVTQPNGSTSTWAEFATSSGWSSQVVGDFNGDGRDDIANFHPGNGTWWVSRSTGSGFTTTLWADFSTPSGWTIQLVGDFDGDGRDDLANRHVGNGTWWTATSSGGAFAPAKFWGAKTTFDHISQAWVQDINKDGRDDVLTVDAYNGFLDRHTSIGSGFDIDTIADMPWRTTVGGDDPHRTTGTVGWLFFGQEFKWIRLSGLSGVAPQATANVVATLARP